VSEMRREFAAHCFAVAFALSFLSSTGICGYSMSSYWASDSRRFWYVIEVESGSPPPFRDLHVETQDADPAHYQLAKAPEGWQMSVVPKDDGTGEAWINFYGDLPCTFADIRVEYNGVFEPRIISGWHLTDDGNPDPDTGLIPGESGDGAYGAWITGGNIDCKVAVHVMPHADRGCGWNQPVITSCADIVAATEANDVDFFPVFYDLTEYHCLEYSVHWPGTYSCAFTPCDFLHIGDIVWPVGTVPVEDQTDWIMHCFDGCQPGPTAVPGWGWIYEPGPATIRIAPTVGGGWIGVLDCADEFVDEPICNFAAGIGGAPGEEPCGPSAAEPTSWGAIKAMFE
jgi:hypothetical protein